MLIPPFPKVLSRRLPLVLWNRLIWPPITSPAVRSFSHPYLLTLSPEALSAWQRLSLVCSPLIPVKRTLLSIRTALSPQRLAEWSEFRFIVHATCFLYFLFTATYRQRSYHLTHRVFTRKPPAISQYSSITLLAPNSTAHPVSSSNGRKPRMVSYVSRFSRPPCTSPPISVGTARSDCPRWTTLACGRMGHSSQPMVCLRPLFYHFQTKDIYSDLCAKFRGIPCPSSTAVVNFRLLPITMITSAAAALQLLWLSHLQTPRNYSPSLYSTLCTRRLPGLFGITMYFPSARYPSLSVGEGRLSLEDFFLCSHLSLYATD